MEADDIRVSQFGVNLEFSSKLMTIYQPCLISVVQALVAYLLSHLFLRHFRSNNFQRKDPAIAHKLSFITNCKPSLPEEQPRRVFFAIFSRLSHDRRWWRRMNLGGCSLCGRRSRRGVTIHLLVSCGRLVL